MNESVSLNNIQSPAKRSHRLIIVMGIIIGALGVATFIFKIYSFYHRIQKGEGLSLALQFNKQFTPSNKPLEQQTKPVDVTKLVRPSDVRFGRGPLTIVQFADFECPYSKKEYNIFRELALKYQNQFTFVFRHLPLTDVHQNAEPAALAALCAQEQNKFWLMHDKLYQNSDRLQKTDLVDYALEIGLDKNKFVNCLETKKYRKKILEDGRDAETLGVRGTPTFFINGQKIEGAIPANIFDKILSSMIQSTNTK